MIETNSDSFFYSSILISAIIGGCVLLLMYIVRLLKNNNQNCETVAVKNVIKADKDTKEVSTAPKSSKRKPVEAKKQIYTHPWLLTSLKGHTGQVLDMDFSSNGKYLASCSEDRTVVLWCLKDITGKERRSLRVNIDFDHPTLVRFSPDSKAFAIVRATDNCVEVFRLEKRKDGWLASANKAVTFPQSHVDDIISLNIASNGKFMLTCSSKTDLRLFDLKGVELQRLDTVLMNTWCAKVSPCARFIVASGFSPDVKVWEVSFKNGEFQHVKRAFELCGHTSGIYDVAFDADTSHMATVSKDGTWKLFQTNVEYQKGEDPHLKMTGTYEGATSQLTRIALSPNAEVVAISSLGDISFYHTRDGALQKRLTNVYGPGNPITAIGFDSLGKLLYSSGERHVRIFHNVPGYQAAIITSKEKLKQSGQSSATRERLDKIINENEAFLKTIEV